jgi:hypothetical protein
VLKTRTIYFFLFFIVLLISLNSYAQETSTTDSNAIHKSTTDSTVHKEIADSTIRYSLSTKPKKTSFSFNNKYVNLSTPSSFYVESERNSPKKEILFYIITGFLLLVGLFRMFYSKYLSNLFRLFFNTSLRQGQFTELVLQSRLSSLIFNIVFVISGGIYLWLLLCHYHFFDPTDLVFLPFCIATIFIVYAVKFLIIKFMGWISGQQNSAGQYIFIIFLINKIIGIALLPFIVLIAFGPVQWLQILILLSWLMLGSVFIIRYFRIYGSLDRQLRVSPFHFIIYLVGIEILPLLILYKSIFKLVMYWSSTF